MAPISALTPANTAVPVSDSKPAAQAPVSEIPQSKNDTVEISKQTTAQPPKISRWRLFTGILKNEQIKAINESRMLPENAKFEMAPACTPQFIANNWVNFTPGSRKLLPGYEVQKCLGFAVVVPEDTKGLLFKKVK